MEYVTKFTHSHNVFADHLTTDSVNDPMNKNPFPSDNENSEDEQTEQAEAVEDREKARTVRSLALFFLFTYF